MSRGGGAIGARPEYICYMWNSKLNGTNATQKLAQLRPASLIVMIAEKRMNPLEVTLVDANNDSAWQGKLNGEGLARLRGDCKRFTTRHRTDRGGFVGFCDGHVSFFSFKELNPAGVSDLNLYNKCIWNPFGTNAP